MSIFQTIQNTPLLQRACLGVAGAAVGYLASRIVSRLWGQEHLPPNANTVLTAAGTACGAGAGVYFAPQINVAKIGDTVTQKVGDWVQTLNLRLTHGVSRLENATIQTNQGWLGTRTTVIQGAGITLTRTTNSFGCNTTIVQVGSRSLEIADGWLGLTIRGH